MVENRLPEQLEQAESSRKSRLDQLSTHWGSLDEPRLFLVRYAPAICSYFRALIKNEHDAEEVSQEFLLRAVKLGFPSARPDRGRFRDYLKTAVRNAALTYLQRSRPAKLEDPVQSLSTLPDSGAPPASAEHEWLAEWQGCILARAWRALEDHQRLAPNNLYHTVLELTADYPEESSQALAARAAELAGRPLTPLAFRKQLSRARHLFAQLLALEVWHTLQNPTPEQLEEELIEIGLMEYVRDFLPTDWRTRGLRIDPP
jgi:hypothetical protein